MVRETTYSSDAMPTPDPAGNESAAAFSKTPGAGAQSDMDTGNADDSLRPKRLAEVVGQAKVVDRLKIILDAARKRNEPLGHLLLDGPPGLGKTTMASVLASEMGVDLQLTSGPALVAPRDLVPYLTNASAGSILFIDEIHRLPPAVEEFIYPAMEDFRIDIVLGEGTAARTISMDLQKFTVVGATTRSGMLTAPLRDRFVNREHLEFYPDNELAEIVRRNAAKLNVPISGDAAIEIARRSRGTPRKCNNFLRWARDYALSRADGNITSEVCTDAFTMLGVDSIGLDTQDRKYLTALMKVFSGGPAGLKAIAHSLNLAPDTLEDEVEPFLLRIEFLQRTPRGRMITGQACRHLGIGTDDSGKSAQGELFD